jgi:hydrophobic/amphiphilic exporter-1 (mainly G- bacteria), HAE1 family
MLGAQTYALRARLNQTPAAALGVYLAPGANALQTADQIKRILKERAEQFPPDMKYETTLDFTAPIKASMHEIEHTLIEAIILVLIVVYVFLQSFRATIIPMLTVPVSLLGAFIAFPLLGFSVNTLTLFGLVLAIGIVVDDAIVVVEAVQHHLEHGLSPHDATVKAMKEVSGPVIMIALILCAVFVPVAFMGGVTGQLYQQFAITVAVAVVFSAMCSKFSYKQSRSYASARSDREILRSQPGRQHGAARHVGGRRTNKRAELRFAFQPLSRCRDYGRASTGLQLSTGAKRN